MAKHRWSGWPGAWCLDCGQEDPNEVALAHGDHDGHDWCDEATREWYVKAYPPVCPCPGEGRCDPYKRQKQE